MGHVVAATHLALNRRVALKLLRSEVGQDPVAVARFLREARATASMQSEHVCRVLDFGSAGGVPFIAMELLEGNTLAQLLTENRQLGIETTCEYALQTCDAIGEAHSLGVLHRDLKPANLFLASQPGGNPRVKVLDFGVSKALLAGSLGEKSLTDAHMMLGTPLYVSPEQLKNSKRVDARTDVWSLGVILYEMLGGRPPFEHRSVDKVFVKIASEDPQPLSELRPDIPPQLEGIVMRCLQRDADARFANAGELGLELANFAPYYRARFERLVSFARAPSWRPSRSAAELGVPSDRPPRLRMSSSPPPPDPLPSSLEPHTAGSDSRSQRLRMRSTMLNVGAVAATAATTLGILYGLSYRGRAESPLEPLVSVSAAAIGTTSASRQFPDAPIQLSLSANPRDAVFFLDGQRLPGNPYRGNFDRDGKPHWLETRAPGHITARRQIQFDGDVGLLLDLAADATAALGPKPQAISSIQSPELDAAVLGGKLDKNNPFGR